MKGDFSRDTFNPLKHFNSVRLQQGRVITDADWNEESDIHTYLRRVGAKDIIGCCGVPEDDAGFEISRLYNEVSSEADLAISPGRIYSKGVLCELEATPLEVLDRLNGDTTVQLPTLHVDGRDFTVGEWVKIFNETDSQMLQITDTIEECGTDPDMDKFGLQLHESVSIPLEGAMLRRITTYKTQPEFPNDLDEESDANLSIPTEGTHLVYLDVWRRHITHLEDSSILEPALDGVDTATRAKTTWQVKLHNLNNVMDAECRTYNCRWLHDEFKCTGKMAARAMPTGTADKPCELPDKAGYRGLENQLYRVEIHNGNCDDGTANNVTFKWSRENGSITARWEKEEVVGIEKKLTLSSSGRDPVLGLKAGCIIELTNEFRQLRRMPGELAKVKEVDGNVVTIEDESGIIVIENFEPNPIVRRWDHAAADSTSLVPPISGDWISLEDGIEVKFEVEEGKTYRTGDYWLIPARTVQGQIMWPTYDYKTPLDDEARSMPIFEAPHGIEHHYCPLALITFDNQGVMKLSDCRSKFAPLVDLYNSCRVTVGYGGRFATLEEAMKALEGRENVCICLLPGIYNITDEEMSTYEVGRNLTITGCGEASIVRIQIPQLRLQTTNITLCGVRFDILYEDGQLLLQGFDITVEGCVFNRPYLTESAPPMVRVMTLPNILPTTLNFNNNRLFSAFGMIPHSNMWEDLTPYDEPVLTDIASAISNIKNIDPLSNLVNYGNLLSVLVGLIVNLDVVQLNLWCDICLAKYPIPFGEPASKIYIVLDGFFNRLLSSELNEHEINDELDRLSMEYGISDALALATSIQGWIKNNYILGAIGLHHAEGSPPFYTLIPDNDLQTAFNNLAQSGTIGPDGCMLSLDSNRVYAIYDYAFFNPDVIGLNFLALTNNLFIGRDSCLVARLINLTGNSFPGLPTQPPPPEPPVPLDVAYIRSTGATLIGNLTEPEEQQTTAIRLIAAYQAEAANLVEILPPT